MKLLNFNICCHHRINRKIYLSTSGMSEWKQLLIPLLVQEKAGNMYVNCTHQFWNYGMMHYLLALNPLTTKDTNKWCILVWHCWLPCAKMEKVLVWGRYLAIQFYTFDLHRNNAKGINYLTALRETFVLAETWNLSLCLSVTVKGGERGLVVRALHL